jgi:hypothetical protein
MAGNFMVQVRGRDALAEQLRSKKFMWQPTRQLIDAAGKAAQKTAMRASKGQAGKGTLGKHIHLEFRDSDLTAVVLPTRRIAGIAFTIEEGRKPGRRPPYTPIKRWMIQAGIISGDKGESKRIQFMRETIKQRGTKGLHFMAAGRDAADKVIREGIPKTAGDVKALWKRPGI